jgi:hypothetical protein
LTTWQRCASPLPAASMASMRGSRPRSASDSSIRSSLAPRSSVSRNASSSAACSAAPPSSRHLPPGVFTGSGSHSQRRRANSRVARSSRYSARARNRRAAAATSTTLSSDIPVSRPAACSTRACSASPGGMVSDEPPGPKPRSGSSPRAEPGWQADRPHSGWNPGHPPSPRSSGAPTSKLSGAPLPTTARSSVTAAMPKSSKPPSDSSMSASSAASPSAGHCSCGMSKSPSSSAHPGQSPAGTCSVTRGHLVPSCHGAAASLPVLCR